MHCFETVGDKAIHIITHTIILEESNVDTECNQ